MRPIASFTLHAILAAALTALAASSAAAADMFLKFTTVDGDTSAAGGRGERLEVESWHWGSVATADADGKGSIDALTDGVILIRNSDAPGAAKYGAVGGMHRDAGIDGTAAPVGGSEKQTIGATRSPSAGKDSKLQELRARSVADIDKAPEPAEKRQHGWMPSNRPLDRGAVRVKVKFPWLGCAEGARYPHITLGDGANSYQLSDVTVASCGGGEGPEKSVTLTYRKVTVRAWNPEKKEL
jgi:hypothetical protein